MLDLRRLEVLAAVAEHGSISAGAVALGLTQPAVSHHVARLEDETGTLLLERGARGVTPTAAGRLLLRHAATLLDRATAAERDLQDLVALRTGRVRVAAFPTAFVDLVPSAIAAVRAEHPGIEVALTTAGHDDALAAVADGAADVGVVFTAAEPRAVPAPPARTARTALLEDRMLAVLPRDHRLAARRDVLLADLADDRWVLGTATGRSAVIRRACAAAGFEPDVAFVSDDLLAVQGVVAAGLAVSLAPALAVAHRRPDVVLKPVADQRLTRRIAAVHRGEHAPPAAKALVAALVHTGSELTAAG